MPAGWYSFLLKRKSMSLRSRFYIWAAQASAALDKLNGAPQPFGEIVQEDLDRSLKDALRRRRDKAAVALMEAGGDPGQTSEEAREEAAVYLSLYEDRNGVDAGGGPVWTARDEQFLRSLNIAP